MAKDANLQILPNYDLRPFGSESLEVVKGFKPNQILKSKLTGARKERSLIQLHLYWVLCGIVAENKEGWAKEDVDFHVKVELKHIKAFRVIKNATFIEVDSISFANLEHLEACNFFDRAFPVMAKMINVTTEQLLSNANETT